MTSLLRIIGKLLKLIVELIGGARVWVDTRRRLVASISLQKLNLLTTRKSIWFTYPNIARIVNAVQARAVESDFKKSYKSRMPNIRFSDFI